MARDAREALEDEMIVLDDRKAEPRCDLLRGTSREDDTVRRRSVGGHGGGEALDRAGAGLDRAARDRIRRALREFGDLALGEAQPRGAAVERAAHELRPGNDEAAEESSVRGERVHGKRGTGVHDELVSALERVRGDERRPAVGPELLRVAIPVHDAELRARRADEGRLELRRAARTPDRRLDGVAGD